MEKFELIDKSSQFYKCDDVSVYFITDQCCYKKSLRFSLNKVHYCLSDSKHQTSAVIRVKKCYINLVNVMSKTSKSTFQVATAGDIWNCSSELWYTKHFLQNALPAIPL